MEDKPRKNRRVLWKPSKEWIEESNVSSYMRWLEDEKKLSFRKYDDLWKWSVTNLEDFWGSIWQYFDIVSSKPYKRVLSSRKMPRARWFEGATLNYAEHVFNRSRESDTAIIFRQEDGKEEKITYSRLQKEVGALTSWLRKVGLTQGDTVAAYLPNIPQAVIAFLACASIGAIWSSCSPDFGAPSVIDRFAQIKPKVMFSVDAYNYNGKSFDKGKDLQTILRAIPSIERVVAVRASGNSSIYSRSRKVYSWEEARERDGAEKVERVPFDHPLWILYSSGTTGPPKPIVQGHGGILLEHCKVLALHNDLKPDSRFFWFTSTGWMMWNYLVSGLLMGASVMLYEGSPSYPSFDALWRFCEKERVTFFGTSAAYVAGCIKSGIRPKEGFNLKALRGIGSTGSPLTIEGFRWVYQNVKKDLWLSSISGGTDVCTAFVGGCPILPVREGEIQCRCLGAKVEAFNEDGKQVYNETGELVITEPMPSMPLFFWNDRGNKKYFESYFSAYPGVWRHGDWISIARDGSCIIYGRSDATIKRMGVRIGSSEIYKTVESIPEVLDSLVVSLEYLGKESFMPLFVVLRDGCSLDDSLRDKIAEKVRADLSPRFVPDEIIAVSEIPKTLNGKKPEVPIRRILLGTPSLKAVNPDSLKNPQAMEFFESFAVKIRKKLSENPY
jgi:acetoacetyl-CoA synthetase